MNNAAVVNIDDRPLVELDWPQVIAKAEDKFLDTAPDYIDWTAEQSFAVQALKANDYLMKVAMNNKPSLWSAMVNIASVGLSLNPAKKQAYLVPRKGMVCFDPSYMGMCDLATMSGSIKWVQAYIVYSNDDFVDNGAGERPTHKYNAFARKADRGEFAGVYCVAKTADGDYLTTVMPAEDVNGIMNRSEAVKSGSFSPWKTDFEEMAKKSVVRRAFKMWPKTKDSERLERAIALSNENEGFAPLVNNPRLADYSDDQKKYFDQLIENRDSIGMFLFSQAHKDSGVWDALFNSFEKGSITKYKQIVRDLESQGASQLMDCVAAINEAEDEGAIVELIETASEDELAYYLEHCSAEACEIIREIQQ